MVSFLKDVEEYKKAVKKPCFPCQTWRSRRASWGAGLYVLRRGDKRFDVLPLTPQTIRKSLEEAGCDVREDP